MVCADLRDSGADGDRNLNRDRLRVDVSRRVDDRTHYGHKRVQQSHPRTMQEIEDCWLPYIVADAFDDHFLPADRCVNPNLVLCLTSAVSIVGVAIGLVIATRIERRRLRQDGGWALGLAVGGRHVESPPNPHERKFINVVEEMAIAMHTTPPAVFVLENEPGINVFAAGLTPEDSILGVTAGAIKHLRRDELQAIVAHEYSHLISGDTRIGTRLTASLYALGRIHVLAEETFHFGRDMTRSDGEVWAVDLLSRSSPTMKLNVLVALANTVASDSETSETEAELLDQIQQKLGHSKELAAPMG